MRFGWSWILLSLAAAQAALPAAGTSYVGRLGKELVADPVQFSPSRLAELGAEKVPIPLAEGEKAFGGSAPPWRGAEPLPVVLIESADQKPLALLYDLDRDGKLTGGERIPLSEGAAETRLALSSGAFSSYPLRFLVALTDGKSASFGGARVLFVSFQGYLEGKVEVGGRSFTLRYAVFPGQDLDPAQGEQGADANGDGEIEGHGTPETEVAQGTPPVFPLGSLYVSTRKLDLAGRTFELVSHDAADYQRISTSPGADMPDFAFTDFAGKEHKLSELRGKYVLIDFWATWCAPCLAELPHLKAAYEKYKAGGFEIVTVAYRDEAAKAAKLVEKEQLAWLQGTAESTEELATKRLRIQGIPYALLVDRQGKIVLAGGIGQPGLRGELLQETLAPLFAGAAAPAKNSGL